MCKPSKSELVVILGIRKEEFHREIKPIIKLDFKDELQKKFHADNPYIWLDEKFNMILVNPQNDNEKLDANLSIYNYK